MKKSVVLLLALLASGTALAAPITFESDPLLDGATKVDLNPAFSTNYDEFFFAGGSFSNWSGVTLSAFYGGFQAYSSSAGGEATPSLVNGGNNSDPVAFMLNFDHSVSAFGMFTSAVNFDGWILELLDVSNSVIETLSFEAGSLEFSRKRSIGTFGD